MSYIEIDWELADKIYAREEDKILEDDKKRKQEKAKDCQSRGIMANTTSYRVGMRRIDMEKFERLKDARINADWQVVYKAKENITDRVFANIVTRLNQTLSTHIGRSVSIYGSQEEYNKTKAILLAKAKKELEIRGGLLMIDEKIEEMKKKRFQFLYKLYDITKGDEWGIIPIENIYQELNFDREFALKIAQYLKEEGLLEFMTFGPTIRITHSGVIEIEEAISKPSNPTEHFPPVNIISIGQMVNSQIQQSSPGANQTTNINEDKLKELGEIVQSLRDSLDKFPLKDQQKSDLQAEIQTIEAQMASSKPKSVIIKESFHSIRNILEGAAGSLLASELLRELLNKIMSFVRGLS
ncbi:MAG: hypothetical protein AAB116_03935 [Candidatus Poribacteria bacterium]